MLLSYLIAMPFLAALFIVFLRPSQIRIIERAVQVAGLIGVVLCANILTMFESGATFVSGKYFALDALSLLLTLLISIVGCIVAFYSIGYLRQEVKKNIIGPRRVKQFFILFELFLFAMLVAANAANPVLMWIAIEATTLSTAFLISFYNKPTATEAAWKYLIINSLGLLIGFLGTLLFLALPAEAIGGGIMTWADLRAAASEFHPVVVKVAFIFVLVGYGTKIGLVPMHTWLPDAHGKAPSPISALLSGVLLNVALVSVLRFKGLVDLSIGQEFSSTLLMYFGLASIVVAAIIIFTQRSYKRLLAYSSIEHMGIIVLGIGFGGVGTLAAFFHILYHSVSKTLLFLAAGNILLRFGSTKFENVSGVIRALPITGALFLAGFLAISGLPPFGMFFSKFLILSSGADSHMWVVMIALIALALAFYGFFRHISPMLFGPLTEGVERGEAQISTIVPLCILVGIYLIGSFFFPDSLLAVFHDAAAMVSLK
ncbi:MAG: hydrogenase 4 subunit F [Candidatus Moranbacteria bacterium]|jgi:hydrogenase-4 component F|nr:hydrogenase 4 subunit F [Candidatus Moranbacteria bacterium]MBP9801673.1 hydrogenase 4 subunit F [Candidatus Moranbacteria bacterium]